MPNTNQLTATQVLIVGAGPTGLTLACELARRNIGFQIIDAAPRHPIGSRGKGLQPRSLEVFEDLSVIDQILSGGRFHLRFRAYDGTAVLREWDWHEGRVPTPQTPYASTMIIPQTVPELNSPWPGGVCAASSTSRRVVARGLHMPVPRFR